MRPSIPPSRMTGNLEFGDGERIGRVIEGRYQLEQLIGRGGMGVVYRAVQLGLGRSVAVKIISAALAANPEVRGRFEREAMAIGKIEHKHCVGVYDVGALDDGSLYLVMELLQGQSLGTLLATAKQLAPARVVHIVTQILTGLAHVHAAGLVHRDIKPENIYLVQNGNDQDFVKILDFGIAKPMSGRSFEEDVKLTQAGMAFGTPIYMAPEQALGNQLDGRADLYAVAVMTFELLCGNPPFFSDDKLEVMSMHTAKPAPRMAERLMGGGKPVDASFEHVVARGLAKRPDERYQTAHDFASALADALGASMGLPARLLTEVDIQAPLRNDATELESDPQPGSRPLSLTNSGSVRYASSTHSDRAATVATTPRRTWRLLFVGLMLSAVAVGAYIGLREAGTEHVGDEAVLSQAQRALDGGDPGKAIRLLVGQAGASADAQLLLGHAHAARHNYDEALNVYEQATKAAPQLGQTPQLRANLRAMTSDKNDKVGKRAFELMFALDARWATTVLIEAGVADQLEMRRLARGVANDRLLTARLDLLASYALDLDQESSCEKRRDAIAKLRALGDVNAVPALERAIVKKGRAGAWKNKPVNQCLVDDANAAIVYLKSLATTPR